MSVKQELDEETNKSVESHLETLKTKFDEIIQKQNLEAEKLEAETEIQHRIKTAELKLLQEEKLKFIGENIAELRAVLQIDDKNKLLENEREKLVSELNVKKIKFETEIVNLEFEVKNLDKNVLELEKHKIQQTQLNNLLAVESERMDDRNEKLERVVVNKMIEMDEIKESLKSKETEILKECETELESFKHVKEHEIEEKIHGIEEEFHQQEEQLAYAEREIQERRVTLSQKMGVEEALDQELMELGTVREKLGKVQNEVEKS